MLLPYATYESIKRDVFNLMLDFDITRYPIDPIAICKQMGIRTVPYSDLDACSQKSALALSEDAFLVGGNYYDLKNMVIVFNDHQHPGRLRYNICHELGHVVREHRGHHAEQEESEAQFFAGYLLAPVPLVIQYCPRCYPGNIAIDFDVSDECSRVVYKHATDRIKIRQPWKDYEMRIIEMCTVKDLEVRPMKELG